MIITPPLIRLNQGDPITSQGVNNILSAIRIIYEALNRPSFTLTITVKNQANGSPVPGATVSLISKGKGKGQVRTGLYAGSEVKSYVVHQIQPGAYTLVVEAKGFNPEIRQIAIDETEGPWAFTIEMMTKAGNLFPVPNMFGKPVKHAIDEAKQNGFQIVLIIDSHGKEISPDVISKDFDQSILVLNQEPAPGALFQKHYPVQLHISAKAKIPDLVRTPNLKGLTINEAEVKLESCRLALGNTMSLSLVMGMIYMANTHTKETHSTIHPCAWVSMVNPENRLFCKAKPEGFKWCDYCFPEKADG